jgi:RNAse (barnase) inhibitor barstar
MGMLEGYTGGMNRIKEKLDQADAMGLNLSDLLGKKFEQVNTSLEKNLKTLVEQSSQSQSRAFQTAVQDAVLNITRSQQIMLNSNMGVLQELLKLKEELSEEVDEVKSGVGSSSESLSGQINEIAKGIERLPTSFPKPEKVDLSKVLNGIMNLDSKVKSLPTSIPMPEKVSFTSIEKRISALEETFKKRVHVFEIERKNDQISKVTVKVK